MPILAAADIGSNTAHLLVAEVGESWRILANRSEWLGLGEAVARSGHVPPKLADELVDVLTAFRQDASKLGAKSVYVFATEAMRMASNREELAARVAREAGVQVDVIAPRREAELSLRGVALDLELPDPMLLLEVGGGSAQIARCASGRIADEVSVPIGTGRLAAQYALSCPAADVAVQAAHEGVRAALAEVGLEGRGLPAVASGGVARGLWRALHPDGERELMREELEYLAWSVQRLSPEQIMRRYNVKQKRAASLLSGAITYLQLMSRFALPSITVSVYGVREGAIMLMREGQLGSCQS